MNNQEHSGMTSDGDSNPMTDWDHSTPQPKTLAEVRREAYLRIESILNRYNYEPEELVADIMHWCDEEDVDMYVDELIDAAKLIYVIEIDNENSELV